MAEYDRLMKEEVINLPHRLVDPYAISMHLMSRYEDISNYKVNSNDDISKHSYLGIAEARYSITDMTKRRYRELIDLEVPVKTNSSLDELLELPANEYRNIIKIFKEQAKDKRALMDKASSEVNKAKGMISKAKRNQLS